ncbi:MAG: glycosyltransferase family 9 protein [Bdellovibrionales bacterium]|nr:glycosyltransferase family 9 protein [Bdellovibrionales bacterium]
MKPKALIIRLSSLGDVVHATAAAEALSLAGWEVSMVTKAAFAPLLQGHPHLAAVHSYEPARQGESAARAAFFSWVEAEQFHAILDLHDSLRTRLWRFRLRRVAKVYVARKPRLREMLILLFRLGKWVGFPPGGRALRCRDLAHQVVREFGGEPVPSARLTRLSVAPEESEPALLPKEPFLVLLPGSAWPGKKWPGFRELAMSSPGPVVVLGGPEDKEAASIAEAARQRQPASVSLQGKAGLREAMAVLARARAIVANDTGMAHVAEALGRPVIVVEGPTHPWMGFSPWREESSLLGLDLVCRPCGKTGRLCWRFGLRTCLKGVTASAVLAEVRRHWGRP